MAFLLFIRFPLLTFRILLPSILPLHTRLQKKLVSSHAIVDWLQRSRHRIVSLYRSNRVESSVLTFFLIFHDRCSRGEREENYLRSGRLRRVVIIDETKCTYECINALPGRLKIQHTCEGEKFREMMTSNRSNNRRRRWNPIAQYQPSFTHISTSACSFFNDPRYHNANFLRSFVDMLDFTSFAIKWKFSTKFNL